MPKPVQRRLMDRPWLRRGLTGFGIGLLAVAAACSTGQWREENGSCVYESDDAPKRRVINTVDPELCGRDVKERGPIRLRVPPEEDKDD
jgi:hypothetical protein